MQDNNLMHGGQDNAMTEIALALAMGFFSLMVLTLVSMGAENASETEQPAFDGIEIAATDAPSNIALPAVGNDVFIMFLNDDFYDHKGNAIDPRTIEPRQGGRVILVVDPAIPLTEIVRVKTILSKRDVIVAEMNQEWVTALSTKGYTP